MRRKIKAYTIINVLISTVWLVNGLVCKVMNLVPRHQQIVARILGSQHAQLLTKVIGVSEILMSLWVLSGKYSRLNAAVQILIIGSMNAIEFVFAPDLLLWGRLNAVFAFLFIVLIYFNEFSLKKEFAPVT
jgi:hypothetical protein